MGGRVNRDEAIALLNKYCPAKTSWRAHCLQVSTAARHLAELLSRRGHTVDVERATVLGLLHDVGRSQGHSLRHGVEGYLLAQAEGCEEAGRICLVHILKGRTLEQGVDLGMLTDEERLQMEAAGWSSDQVSLEEKIVTLADAMMRGTTLVPVEQKYDDARRRYGATPHHDQDEAWVKGLAAEISQLLGAAPYEVLLEASDDLL